jgi:hypothetical protein
MNKENVLLRLELIAAKARSLAADLKTGLQPPDLRRRLDDLDDEIDKVKEDAKERPVEPLCPRCSHARHELPCWYDGGGGPLACGCTYPEPEKTAA